VRPDPSFFGKKHLTVVGRRVVVVVGRKKIGGEMRWEGVESEECVWMDQASLWYIIGHTRPSALSPCRGDLAQAHLQGEGAWCSCVCV